MFKKLVSDSGIRNLQKHVYKAGEVSKLDAFITSKVSLAVDHFPKNLAPNMITLIGALIHISSSLLFMCYELGFTTSKPSYTFFYAALTLWIYQLLDIADGKQARRLHLSSPLGQLFDHGLDCITSTFILFNILVALKVGDSKFYVGMGIFVVVNIFYFANWAEYHTGNLVTCSNGVGIIEVHYVIIIIYILTGVYGSELWENRFMGILLKDLVIILCLAVLCFANTPIYKNAYKQASSKLRFFKTLIPIYSFFVCLLIIFNLDCVQNSLFALFFICNFFYNINCCKLIVMSMSGMKFSAFHREMFIFYVFTGLLLLMENNLNICTSIIKLFFIVSFALLMNLGFRTTDQISTALGIKILTV